MNERTSNHIRHRSQGFTLLELLIATIMFSVIVGALYSVFYGAIRLREKAYETFEERLPIDYAIALIKRDLRAAVAPGGLLAGATIGENEEESNVRLGRLEIHTASGITSESAPWGDLQKVEYYLAETVDHDGTEGRILVRAITRNLLASTDEGPDEEHLFGGVQSLVFSFYDGEDWLETWDTNTEEESELPLAIRTRIDFQPPIQDERRVLPIDLIVPLVTKPIPDDEEQTDDSQEEERAGEEDDGGAGPGQETGGGQPPDGTAPGEGGGGGRP